MKVTSESMRSSRSIFFSEDGGENNAIAAKAATAPVVPTPVPVLDLNDVIEDEEKEEEEEEEGKNAVVSTTPVTAPATATPAAVLANVWDTAVKVTSESMRSSRSIFFSDDGRDKNATAAKAATATVTAARCTTTTPVVPTPVPDLNEVVEEEEEEDNDDVLSTAPASAPATATPAAVLTNVWDTAVKVTSESVRSSRSKFNGWKSLFDTGFEETKPVDDTLNEKSISNKERGVDRETDCGTIFGTVLHSINQFSLSAEKSYSNNSDDFATRIKDGIEMVLSSTRDPTPPPTSPLSPRHRGIEMVYREFDREEEKEKEDDAVDEVKSLISQEQPVVKESIDTTASSSQHSRSWRGSRKFLWNSVKKYKDKRNEKKSSSHSRHNNK